MGSSWRDHCRPIIARILRETAGQDEKAIKKALYDAYPYGERRMLPYKVWLDEIKRQRGLKPDPAGKGHRNNPAPHPGQGSLFPRRPS